MRPAIALILLAGAALFAPANAGNQPVEEIEIAGGERPLKAVLYRPTGDGPFPAVVALHSCGGLFDEGGKIRPQYQDWGERLAAAGFAALLPDSFGSRGVGSQCRNLKPNIRPFRERITDTHAARDWLQRQSFVQGERISLLGWANGAIAALWAVRPRTAPKDGRADFRSAIVFYPGCRRLRDTAWSARIPTLILIGASDDWTPARDCEQMVAGARGRSAHATIIKYRGAYHDFDRVNYPVHQRSGLAFTPDGSGRATVGSNPVARADALKRVPEWLAR
jgi:dienelactone hydrolase